MGVKNEDLSTMTIVHSERGTFYCSSQSLEWDNGTRESHREFVRRVSTT